MKPVWIRVIALVTAVLICFGITGCGQDTTSGGSSSGADASNDDGLEPIEQKNDMSEEEQALYDKYLSPLVNREAVAYSEGFSTFITRNGTKLYDGDKEFVFSSINVPNMSYNMDDHTIAGADYHFFRRYNVFEIDDVMKTINEIGGQAMRIQTFTVRRLNENFMKAWYAPGSYDELVFRDFDRVLAACNTQKVRIIIPIINPWWFVGGGEDFDLFCDGDGTLKSFYTRKETIDEYKKFVSYILNRVNYFTGVAYKDDKSILCWELGNELTHQEFNKDSEVANAVIDWEIEIAKYIKSIDKNHLVMDGGVTGTPGKILNDENIDILTTHYFEPRDVTQYNKVGIHGEYDPTSKLADAEGSYIDKIINKNKNSGALVWSLRQHNKNGGFLYHVEDWTPKAPTMRYPGFSSGAPNEKLSFDALKLWGFKLQGKTVPAVKKPEPPELLPIYDPTNIRWRGSVGALTYDLERADSESGPFTVIAKDLTDHDIPIFKPYNDTGAVGAGKTLFYRIIAKNGAGASEPSNIIPYFAAPVFVNMEEEKYGKMFVDEMGTLFKLHAKKGEINIGSGLNSSFDFSAFTFDGDAVLVYKFDEEIKDAFLLMNWVDDMYKNVDISFSKDGKTYDTFDKTFVDYGENKGIHIGRYDILKPGDGCKFIKVTVKKPTSDLTLNRLEVYFK